MGKSISPIITDVAVGKSQSGRVVRRVHQGGPAFANSVDRATDRGWRSVGESEGLGEGAGPLITDVAAGKSECRSVVRRVHRGGRGVASSVDYAARGRWSSVQFGRRLEQVNGAWRLGQGSQLKLQRRPHKPASADKKWSACQRV